MLTTVYAVCLKDRHTDMEVFIYTNEQEAVKHAVAITNQYLERYTKAEQGYMELGQKAVPGWVYYAVLSGEGDSVAVMEKVVKIKF